MRILVLGASSVIGQELAVEFARSNTLLLMGRNLLRLQRTAAACQVRGAANISTFVADLASEGDWTQACVEFEPDCVLNAACATSRLRDHSIPGDSLGPIIRTDLSAPVELIDRLRAARPHAPLRLVFVSTVLALIPSQERAIYGGLKRMQERALLHRASRDAMVQVLFARICRPIPPDEPSLLCEAYAKATYAAFLEGRSELSFGWSGRAAMVLHAIHPMFFRCFIAITRKARQ